MPAIINHDQIEGQPLPNSPAATAGQLPRHQLPAPLTSFVGRDRDRDDVLAMLSDSKTRLVTLTGPGGVGKTRLALRAAEEIASEKQRQIVFIPLAALADSDHVLTSIGKEFRVSDANSELYLEAVAAAIADRDLLLILDNFERVVNAAPLLTGLLSRCPLLTILVTSRVLLRVSGERGFAVRPLEPPSQNAALEQIGQTPAVQLFLDRMQPYDRSAAGEHTSSELTAIAEICRRLDGLPLAIELAAARARMLSPAGLLARLDFHTLLKNGPRDAPLRLQSMYEAVAWSYDMLTGDEQVMLRLLSVFSGGFTLETAEALFTDFVNSRNEPGPSSTTGSHGIVADLRSVEIVLSLVEQSLVERLDSDSGPARFTLLETIREFGRERLKAAGEEHAVLELHAQWFANRAGVPSTDRTRLYRDDESDPLGYEHDNLRAALTWSLEQGQVKTATYLVCAIWHFWWRNSLYTEARVAHRQILKGLELADPGLRASILNDAAYASMSQSDFLEANNYATEGLRLCQELGDQACIAGHLRRLGEIALITDPVKSIEYFDDALDIRRELGDNELTSVALMGVGAARMHAGDVAAAKTAYTESLTIIGDEQCCHPLLGWVAMAEGEYDLASRLIRETCWPDDPAHVVPYYRAWGLRLLGRLNFFRGNLELATNFYRNSLDILVSRGSEYEAGQCIGGLAAVAQACGEPERAARWLGFEEAVRERQELGLAPDEREMRMRTRALAIESLGNAEFTRCWEAGRSMQPGAVFAEARSWMPTLPDPGKELCVLTRRELEVLEELALGRSNEEIAGDLFVSKRTIETHVASILAKLDVKSRGAAVKAGRERGLLPQ